MTFGKSLFNTNAQLLITTVISFAYLVNSFGLTMARVLLRQLSTAARDWVLPAAHTRAIVVYPHKVLTTTSASIAVPCSLDVLQLLSDLIKTCRENDGLGLAAPQVGASLRAFVMRRPSPLRPSRMWRRAAAAPAVGDFWVCVNPRVTALSGPGITGVESCLSVPDASFLVRRQRDIAVEFLDASGAPVSLRLEGLPAVIFQHELDHLDGVLVPDRELRAFEHTSHSQEQHRAEVLWETDVREYYQALL